MHNTEIQVVAGIIQDRQGHILLAKRQAHQHQGSLWEFPGGKKEPQENAEQALKRELWEEIGIQIKTCYPAINISHHYLDKSIRLDVWWVSAWDGMPYGKEGQSLRWVNQQKLTDYAFPDANLAILQALNLPKQYLISPGQTDNLNTFLARLKIQLQHGLKLYQLRLANSLNYPHYLPAVFQLCQQYNCQLLLNSGAIPQLSHIPPQIGIHYRAADLNLLSKRPVNIKLCAASCHNPQEIQQAQRLKIDFISLSPVKTTPSHPHTRPIGWQQFWQDSLLANCPVYALGGISKNDLNCARAHGAQGIAGISLGIDF